MQGTNQETMYQYCSVCKKYFEMEVINQGSSDSAIWLKCPGCQGFLPHMLDEEHGGEKSRQAVADKTEEIALEDLDIESAREYSEREEYEIGEIIHHRSWNDYGRVIGKDTLPGNRRTIWAHFLRQGKVQLLEGVK
jgi:hypothetical protein